MIYPPLILVVLHGGHNNPKAAAYATEIFLPAK
jgi:hypothetical protein